jgi:hypothetical protein
VNGRDLDIDIDIDIVCEGVDWIFLDEVRDMRRVLTKNTVINFAVQKEAVNCLTN